MKTLILMTVVSCFSMGCATRPVAFESAHPLTSDQFMESVECLDFWQERIEIWTSNGAPVGAGIQEMRRFAREDKESEFSGLIRRTWAISPGIFSEEMKLHVPSTDELRAVAAALDQAAGADADECGLAWLEPALGNALLNPNRQKAQSWLPAEVLEKDGMVGSAAARYVSFWLLVAERPPRARTYTD